MTYTALREAPEQKLTERDEAAETIKAQAAEIARLREALTRINDWCCFATEEDINARLLALQQIGQAARAALEQA